MGTGTDLARSMAIPLLSVAPTARAPGAHWEQPEPPIAVSRLMASCGVRCAPNPLSIPPSDVRPRRNDEFSTPSQLRPPLSEKKRLDFEFGVFEFASYFEPIGM